MSAIPAKRDNPKGLHQRYIVTKPDEPTDPMATYFVLRLDGLGRDGQHVAACRAAAKAYADYVLGNEDYHHTLHLHQTAKELRQLVENLEQFNG